MVGNENWDKFGISKAVVEFDSYEKEEKDVTVRLGADKFLIKPG